MGVILSNIYRASVGVPGKADEIIRQARLCTFVDTFFETARQDTHAYDMVGRIIAAYIHFVAGHIKSAI